MVRSIHHERLFKMFRLKLLTKTNIARRAAQLLKQKKGYFEQHQDGVSSPSCIRWLNYTGQAVTKFICSYHLRRYHATCRCRCRRFRH
jgi:hypothetical protein